ncbi:MAG: peptidoglycan-binding domain-containing protein, partial [Bradyrhizobium guangdongense]
APAASGGSEAEVEFWRSVKESNKAEELNAYVTAYPNGQFKALALARLAALQNGPSTATRNLNAGVDPATFTETSSQLTEDQIGLDKGQRRDVQRRLSGLGFDTKVTGVFDGDTRNVIKRWQAARGYPVSGFLNKLQHKAMLSEIVATAPATASDDSGPKPARRANSAPAQQQSAPAPHRSGGGDAGAAFVGGVVGGMMGGMFRR